MIMQWQAREILRDAANVIQKHSQSGAREFVLAEITRLAADKISRAIRTIQNDACREVNAVLMETGLNDRIYTEIIQVERTMTPVQESEPLNTPRRSAKSPAAQLAQQWDEEYGTPLPNIELKDVRLDPLRNPRTSDDY